MASRAPVTPTYSEKLWLGPLGWAGVVGLAACLGVAVLPVDALLSLVVGVVAVAALVFLGMATTTRVTVDGGELHAGDAHIPLELLGAVRVLDARELRAELGPRLDARAHLCLRGWIHSGVRVELVDPADPTPYWIVSSRRPEQLAAALTAGSPR
ncbi:DUF3093 domain-containing protein [Cellulomonas edaphi]|uniref:DUF3093 domain-containing protein n=1 Tax=Cellulomonas edaphi TaxID=3053468 RepID=A0ABT7S6X2_9CELL|nr:DUF3093 domain-containing protein [Cellulomons edaphi]MDM7831376.1 DUF3093 domain-containing protein [Cellulomons edaphi]